jgi:hypothetical protein
LVPHGEGSSSGAHAHHSVGRSAAPSNLSGDSCVAHHEGKSLMEEVGSAGSQDRPTAAPSGFMADARCTNSSCVYGWPASGPRPAAAPRKEDASANGW